MSDMDRRSQPRFEGNEIARVTLLAQDANSFTGKMVNISDNGMRLLVDRPLGTSAPVKVQVADATMLGEVTYCQQNGNGYAVGLALDQVLWQTPDLLPLWRALRQNGETPSRTDQGVPEARGPA